MSVRAITGIADANPGDWTFGQGRGNYLTGEAEINQDIATALKVFLGECFFDTGFGVDWWNLIGAKAAKAADSIILQCRKVIAERPGVTKITAVTATIDRNTRALRISYNVSTVFSLQTINTVSISASN